MERDKKRSTRLIDLAEYLVNKRQPVKIRDLVAHYDLHRSTIYRMLDEIEGELETPVERDELGGVWIRPENYRFSIKLQLDEVMAVFLAARLLARYSDKPNPHAVKALNSLSLALQRIAPHIAEHIARSSERLDRALNEGAQDHLRALETLTRAWAQGKRVRLYTREEPLVERLFEPYFIEPSAIGYASYVIGYDHYRHDERTFKIERLYRVYLTTETFTIPANFDPYRKLAGAWGVNWGKTGTATAVSLRFAKGRAADRVRETNWHETQRIEDLPDGGCILHITVGSTLEMKPWIRQWGPDCEVLSPLELRHEIADEMRRAGNIYK